MITTEQICRWVEAIEREMPSPVWVPEKQVFEYEEVTPQIVAFLKLVRAASSLHSLEILAEKGLMYDFGTVTRPIIECFDDALFLLEGNPETKANVEKFVEHFKKTTIDNATASTHQPVKREKIHSARARVFSSLLSGTFGAFGEVEKQIKELRGRIWNAWCNPVHSNYADIMQTYGPRGPRAKFQIRGIPREHVGPVTFTYIQEIRDEAALTLWAAAMKLGFGGLVDETARAILEADGK